VLLGLSIFVTVGPRVMGKPSCELLSGFCRLSKFWVVHGILGSGVGCVHNLGILCMLVLLFSVTGGSGSSKDRWK
jgi:hypothetical protein